MEEVKYSSELSSNEKVIAMRSIFQSGKNANSSNYIKNAGDFISGNFEKINGFDFRWTSLISNNPLLFEDVDYLRVKPFVENTITDEERDAFVRGDLRDLYATFDNMLMCNLKYYDRIMSYCTMVFLHYVRINDDVTNKFLDRVPYELFMTPTRIWAAALSSVNSTIWELNYAWSTNIPNVINLDKSPLESAWKILYHNKTFSKFIEYSAFKNGTIGFRQTIVSDTTSNRKLSMVCAKFTKTSVAISEQQLDTIYAYSKEVDSINKRLYTILDKCLSILFNGDQSQYSIYIFTKEFYIYSSKFTIRVRAENGVISKDYLANSYECFVAEEFLLPSIKTQIEWARFELTGHFEYDKNILKSLLSNMLDENYREILCIKRMNDYGVISKITFRGIFNNVRIIEEFMLDNRCIKSVEKTLSKRNAAIYLIDRGYYIFGVEKDIFNLNSINKENMITHYSNYCIPVMQHMFDVIATHTMSKNDIIDVVVSGTLNPAKLNNENIKYTSLMQQDTKQLFAAGLEKQNKLGLKNSKKSYWKAVE